MKHEFIGEMSTVPMLWSLNNDACPYCGMSGLEMLQLGDPPCTPERRAEFHRKHWPMEWMNQLQAAEAR